jgi:hypothetical protein
MNPLVIDFAPRPQRTALLTGAAFAIAAFSCSAALWEYQSSVVKAQPDDEVQAQQARPVSPASDPSLSLEHVESINQAIGRLNLPWRDLFAAIETRLTGTIALIALEPDSTTHKLKVVAEAKTSDDMVDFWQSLVEDNRFVQVTLTKHEINELDPNRPVRFVLEAQWREGS